jgi:hypothetical protein
MTIPNFRALGMSNQYLDLGAAMSSALSQQRVVRTHERADRAAEQRSAGKPELRRLRGSTKPVS